MTSVHIRPLLNRDAANTVACSMVSSRLDYCNAVLYGVTGHNISRLQRVQNTLARVVCTAPYRSSATHLRKSLHWLPVAERITFKIAMLTFKVRSNHLPAYLDELIINYAPPRSLRSTTQGLLIEPRTRTKIASRAFGSAAPWVWNSLPTDVRTATSIDLFRTKLKTHLFNVAYH